MHGNRGDGGGQRRGRPWSCIRRAADRGQFVARDLGDQFGNQLGLGGEVAVDGAGRDIGANRDGGDLHRRHAALGRSVPRRRQDGATPRRQPLYDLMGSPIHHGVFRPRRALEPHRACQNAHTFNTLSDKCTHRFEEVNNYSRLMTRWISDADWRILLAKFSEPLTSSQRCPASMSLNGQPQIIPRTLRRVRSFRDAARLPDQRHRGAKLFRYFGILHGAGPE
jgi:hypothetical protein